MRVYLVERLAALVGPMFPGSDAWGLRRRGLPERGAGSFPSCTGRRIAFKRTWLEA
jgi:hypothetical protein